MEMRYKTVLFDLDGTIVDSSPGIFNSLKYAFTEMEREIPDEKTLRKFLGPPLEYSFAEFCGFSAEDSQIAVNTYRKRYKDICVTDAALFDGVYDMLERLKAAGVTLALATSKPIHFANQVIAGFKIDGFFAAVCGGEQTRSCGKEDVIRNALELCGASELSGAVMVGDRSYDIDGAKSVGIDSIGVLYGYGEREELEMSGADHLVLSPDEIVRIISGYTV